MYVDHAAVGTGFRLFCFTFVNILLTKIFQDPLILGALDRIFGRTLVKGVTKIQIFFRESTIHP